MLDDATLQQLATELDESARQRQPLRHFSQRFPAMTIDDGYRVGIAEISAS